MSTSARNPAGGERILGREAERPRGVPRGGWKQIASRVGDEIKDDHLVLLSAGVAFYFLLALFPALIAGITVYGLVADPATISDQIQNFSQVLPSSVVSLLTDQITAISTAGATVGIGLAISVAIALWSASSGMNGLIKAVNTAYDEPESRGFLKLRGLALKLTLGGMVFAVLTLGLLVGVPAVIQTLQLGSGLETAIQWGRWPILLAAFALALGVVYRVGPDREDAQWSWVSWGAGIASLIWVAGSALFAVYTATLGTYGETYGSFASIIVVMLWLFITAFAMLLGAEVNAELEHQTVRDTTTGEPQPMGQRGARAADVPPEEPLDSGTTDEEHDAA